MPVTRADLIKRLAASSGISKRDAERALNAVFETIGGGLAREQRIELRGFGVFTRRDRCARNPRTGQPTTVPAKATVWFSSGKMMQKLLNGHLGALAALQDKREAQLRRRDERAGQLRLF